ncbi:hypothetical protein [Methylobacterium sp. WL120]|uniref:hypothetical protein n=1 Tax=Methylobacterium sp. WL120 TaxID=2603887 RepID=UPI0011C7692B|nr:hypothetical protein [Methylobacterium sp. WL120]TXM60963.1 hypothetical protein FV229_23645 [Methylobacterium sp. WL120]
MAFGITGIHGMDQHFMAEEVAPGEFGVAIRQGGDAIVSIRLRDPSLANAQDLATLLGQRASAIITPSVVQAMLEGTMTEI